VARRNNKTTLQPIILDVTELVASCGSAHILI
jgi:hypothetical protein